jgi:hypothetical protein
MRQCQRSRLAALTGGVDSCAAFVGLRQKQQEKVHRRHTDFRMSFPDRSTAYAESVNHLSLAALSGLHASMPPPSQPGYWSSGSQSTCCECSSLWRPCLARHVHRRLLLGFDKPPGVLGAFASSSLLVTGLCVWRHVGWMRRSCPNQPEEGAALATHYISAVCKQLCLYTASHDSHHRQSKVASCRNESVVRLAVSGPGATKISPAICSGKPLEGRRRILSRSPSQAVPDDRSQADTECALIHDQEIWPPVVLRHVAFADLCKPSAPPSTRMLHAFDVPGS